MLTRPEDFFDLGGFEHRGLFASVEHVWEALGGLRDHLAAHCTGEVLGEVAPGALLIGPVTVGCGTVVEPHAVINGPAIIGANCRIRHSAYVRGDIVVGDGCVVGHATELKSSILLPGAKAPHFNYVGDSILGREVNLGAGAVCANLRLDGGEVFVTSGSRQGARLATGRRKLGAIIGDGASIGCNVVLEPGALLPKHAAVLPLASRAIRLASPVLARAR